MKVKKLLAVILSVAIVATSGNFTLDVHATGDGEDVPVVVTDEADSEQESDVSQENGGDGVDLVVEDNSYGSTDGSDQIIDENNYFAVDGNGTLREKDNVPVSSLSGTVALPAKARKIPVGIFNDNSKITGLTISDDSALTEIEAGAFERSGVTSLEIPDGVEEIAERTFKDSKLSTITFHNVSLSKLKSIGSEAFAGSRITRIVMPGEMRVIGESAFKSCLNLKSMNLTGTEVIGRDAFKGCSKLGTDGNSVGFGYGLKEIGDSAFEGSGLTSVSFTTAGAGIETWGTSVFAECKNLTSVTLNSDMDSIPENMFRDCTKLKTIRLPENCTTIETQAFFGCDALTTVTIPENTEIIQTEAFGGCQNLTTVTIEQRDAVSGESEILIADDAFPIKSSITMKGYDGTVEEYADKKGYKFVSLMPKNKISKKINYSSRGTVELSKSEARAGDVIDVTVTPTAGYRLKAGTFYYYIDDDTDDRTYITKLKEETATAQTFSFEMPVLAEDSKLTVRVDFVSADDSYGKLTVEGFETSELHTAMVYWDEDDGDNGTVTFDEAGVAAKLKIKSSRGEQYAPGCWQYTYSSSKKTVAVIDEEGVIYARGQGTATITATLKTDTGKKVKFRVRVGNSLEINYVGLEFDDLGKAKVTTEMIDGEEMTIIEYAKSKRDRSFRVNLNATLHPDGIGTNLFVASGWKTANSGLAYPDEASVWDNSNVIRVKGGVSGETAITVTATNGLTDKKDKVVYGEKTFIVRVIDATPRLVQSSMTVDANSELGTEFELISVYGYEVDPSTLYIEENVKDGKLTEPEVNPYVEVESAGDKLYLKMTKEGEEALKEKGKNISYSNKTFIVGEYVYETEAGTAKDEFRVPIKSLVLTNKTLKPTVKLKGKLNLFFNSNADVEERGEVVLTQSLKTLSVESYELVSQANYAKEGSEAVDSFANNFVVSEDGVLSRSDNELMKDAKGKVVTKGYLKINYEGYKNPCYVKLTVPVQNKKPAYKLSSTKATVNTYSDGYEIKLLLQDKKKNTISLADLRELSFDESAAGITTSLFEPLDTEAAKDTDVITLKIKNTQKGKAIINVEMDTWNEPMKFTFNLAVTNKVPTVKAKNSTLTLNNLCIGRETSTVFTLSQKDVELTDMKDIRFAGKDKMSGEASKIQLVFANGVLSASADEAVQKGSYKFSMTPELTYENGRVEPGKAISVTVKVMDSKLTMSMKSKTLTLNNIFSGSEAAVSTYTIKNMPVGEAVEIISDSVVITAANKASETPLYQFLFTFAASEQTVKVEQLEKVRKGTYKFKVSHLKTMVEGAEVEIQPFTISVKVIETSPKLTLKTSGTLNPCNRSSKLTYAFVMKNTNVKITDEANVLVQELDTTNGLNKPFAELENFEVADYVTDAEGYITGVIVKPKEGVQLNAKTSYKLKLGVSLERGDGSDPYVVWTGALKVKFKQTLPKIKTDVSTATVYAGVAYDSPRRSQEVLITKTSEKNAVIDSVVLAKSNSDNLKKAFRVSFDPDTQKAKVTLVRPDLVKANTTYSVKLEVRVEGQMENTTGPTFTMKIKVLN